MHWDYIWDGNQCDFHSWCHSVSWPFPVGLGVSILHLAPCQVLPHFETFPLAVPSTRNSFSSWNGEQMALSLPSSSSLHKHHLGEPAPSQQGHPRLLSPTCLWTPSSTYVSSQHQLVTNLVLIPWFPHQKAISSWRWILPNAKPTSRLGSVGVR